MNLQLILPCALSIPPIPRFPLGYFGLAFSYYNKYPREPASKEKSFVGSESLEFRCAMDQPWAWGGQYIKAGSTWKSRTARLIVENKTKPEREKERGRAPIMLQSSTR